jgi:hypothetical protein
MPQHFPMPATLEFSRRLTFPTAAMLFFTSSQPPADWNSVLSESEFGRQQLRKPVFRAFLHIPFAYTF